MRCIFIITISIMIFSCKNVKKNIETPIKESATDSVIMTCADSVIMTRADSLMDQVQMKISSYSAILPKDILAYERKELDNKFDYDIVELEDFYLRIYKYDSIGLEILVRDNVRLNFSNRELFTTISFPFRGYEIDSMDMNIMYNEEGTTLVYSIPKHPEYILLELNPMNWTGTFTRYAFYQLVNFKKMVIYQFIDLDSRH